MKKLTYTRAWIRKVVKRATGHPPNANAYMAACKEYEAAIQVYMKEAGKLPPAWRP